MSPPNTRAENAIIWDVTREAGYGGYLCLDLLLAAQQPRSADHDEMLFIIIHQASELWIKLLLHELAAAKSFIAEDRIECSCS
jgi:tryptophan 2,3-dioxygenase